MVTCVVYALVQTTRRARAVAVAALTAVVSTLAVVAVLRLRGGAPAVANGATARSRSDHEGVLFFEVFGGRAFVTELGSSPASRRGVGWALMYELACRPGVVAIHLLVRADSGQQSRARELYSAMGCVAWVGQGAARRGRVSDAQRARFHYVRGGRMQYVPEDAQGEREMYLVVEAEQVRERMRPSAMGVFRCVHVTGIAEARWHGWEAQASAEGRARHDAQATPDAGDGACFAELWPAEGEGGCVFAWWRGSAAERFDAFILLEASRLGVESVLGRTAGPAREGVSHADELALAVALGRLPGVCWVWWAFVDAASWLAEGAVLRRLGFQVCARPGDGEFWSADRTEDEAVFVCAGRADLLAHCGASRVGAHGTCGARRAGAREEGIEQAVFEAVLGAEQAATLTEEMRERMWPADMPTLAVFVRAGEGHREAVRRYEREEEGHQVRAAEAAGGSGGGRSVGLRVGSWRRLLAMQTSDAARWESATWNLKGYLHASGAPSAVLKRAALASVMTDHEFVGVLALQEVGGTLGEFRRRGGMRRWFQERGWEAEFLPDTRARADGELSNYTGVVLAWRTAMASLAVGRKHSVAAWGAGTLAVDLRRRRDGQVCTFVAYHGPASGRVAHRTAAVQRVMERAAGLASAVVLADWNLRPCRHYSVTMTPSSRADRALAEGAEGYCVMCESQRARDAVGAESGGGKRADLVCARTEAGGRGRPQWTWASNGLQGAPRWHSCLDFALVFGGERGRWTACECIAWEAPRAEDGRVSDHCCVVFGRRVEEAPVVAVGRPAKSRVMQWGARALAMFEPALAAGVRQLHGVTGVEPVTEVLMQAVAVADAEHDAARRRAALHGGSCPQQMLGVWKGRLMVALRESRARGLEAFADWEGPMYAGARNLLALAQRAGSSDGARTAVMRRIRMEVLHWSRAAEGSRRSGWKAEIAELEAATGVEMAGAALRALHRFFGRMKPRGPSTSMTAFRAGDAADGELIAGPSAEFQAEGRRIGEIRQLGFAGDGVCPVAFEAWCETWMERWPELSGKAEDQPWRLEDFVTAPHLEEAMHSAAGRKAPGANGFTVEALRAAPPWFQQLFFEGCQETVRSREFPVAWRRVVYVLLAKKHGDQNLVCNQRDIALMAQCLKMVLRVLKLHSYARMAGRVDRAQCGFVRGVGAQDVALMASLLLQGGRRELRWVYLLFVDIRKFFPAIDRTNLTFAEMFHGVPRAVTELVAAIFGEMMGVYDSAHGTCEDFGIFMGALMGCVLSPDRAKLILDTVVVAIRLHTRGVLPWGGNGKSISQLVFCDDWLGIFDTLEDLLAAWAVWCVWELVSGCRLGVEKMAKTVVGGGMWEKGRMRSIPDPELRLSDGTLVPFMTVDQMYVHVGIPRTADGGGRRARAKIVRLFNLFIERLAGVGRTRRVEFVQASNCIVRGVGGFFGAAVWGSFEWADRLEGGWRRLYHRRYGTPAHAARLWFYVPHEGCSGCGGDRVHMHVAMSASLWSGMVKAVTDRVDSDLRRVARCETARVAVAWGCVGPVFAWDPRPYAAAMEVRLGKDEGDDVAVAFWVLWARIGQGRPVRVEEAFPLGDPWGESGAAVRRLSSAHLWQSAAVGERCGGLGIPLEAALLRGGLLQESQLFGCGWDGVARVMSVPEATALGRCPLGKPAAAAWLRVCAAYELLGRAVPVLSWQEGGRDAEGIAEVMSRQRTRDAAAARPLAETRTSGEGVRALLSRVVELTAGPLGTRAAAAGDVARGRAMVGMDAGALAEAKAEVGALLEAAFPAAMRRPAVEEEHGNPSDEVRYGGCHVVGIVPSRERFATGKAAGMLQWPREEAVARVVDGWGVDVEGYVTFERARVEGVMELAEMRAEGRVVPCTVEAFVRAREALVDAPVVTRRPRRRDFNFIMADETRWHFDLLLKLEAELGATALWTLDGSRRYDTEEEVWRSSRAALRHDGRQRGGGMLADDSYTTELAAQLDALWEEGERRVVVCFDAASPVDAWLRWRLQHERQQQGYYQDGLLGSLERAMGRFEVVAFVWIHAHFGVTLNEWADLAAAEALGSPLVELQEGRRAHASLSFGHTRSAAAQASQVQSAHVQARLRAFSAETQWRGAGDIRLPRRRAADEDDLHSLLGRRWFPGDKAYGFGELGRRVRDTLCACCGRAVACTLAHAAWECVGLEEERRDMLSAATVLVGALSGDTGRHGQAAAVMDALRASLFGSLPAGGFGTDAGGRQVWMSGTQLGARAIPSAGSDLETRVLRGLGALWEAAEEAAGGKQVSARRAACQAMAGSVLRWMRAAKRHFQPQVQSVADRLKSQRGVVAAWDTWVRRTLAAGPRRLGALRDARLALRVVGRAAKAAGLGGEGARVDLRQRVRCVWLRRRAEIEAENEPPARRMARLAGSEVDAERALAGIGLATEFWVSAQRWRGGWGARVVNGGVRRGRLELLWAECCRVADMLVRRGDGAGAEAVPAARGATAGDYPEMAEQLRRWEARRCGVMAWRDVLETRARLLRDFQAWAMSHGVFAARRAGATVQGRVAPGMDEGAWRAGVWEVASPEAQDPCCAGCARCRRWSAVERSGRVRRPGEWLLPASKRGVVRQRRAARRQAVSVEEAAAARAAVEAEKGEAAQARFVERCRASWLVDSGYGRRRRGLRTASRMEHAYAQVDRGGHTAEQLVGWQTRRLAKGLPVGAARPGQGRGRKRGRPVGVESEDADQELAPAEQVSAVPVVSPERRRPQRAVVSPRTRERAAELMRTGRARRAVEHAAQREIAYGGIETARAGARLPPAVAGRMAGRPMRGWVRDPAAEGRGSGDRGSTHSSELAPIPKRRRL